MHSVNSPIFLAVTGLAMVVSALGCGGGAAPNTPPAASPDTSPRPGPALGPFARIKDANDLKQIGLGIVIYEQEHGKMPLKADDIKSELEASKAWERLRDGDFVVIWGADLSEVRQKGQSTTVVLGYEKNVPTEGGPVLFADAHVERLTAEQFRSAPKASPK